MFRRFIQDESGATAVEYGLIIAVLSLVIIGGFSKAANSLQFLLGNDTSRLQEALK
jgi:pilus assembly protein Flp/PilA